MNFREKIKLLRKQKGLSQKELADIAGIKQASYSNIENGVTEKNIIKVGTAVNIAKALNISFNDLFDIEFPSSKDEDKLHSDIKKYKAEISTLKEQLDDKRNIIKFLSENNLLLSSANEIYNQEHPENKYKERDFYDIDSLIKELDLMPFVKDDEESLKRYILKRIKEIQQQDKKE